MFSPIDIKVPFPLIDTQTPLICPSTITIGQGLIDTVAPPLDCYGNLTDIE